MLKEETLNKLRKKYTAGTRISLIRMNDKQAPPAGTEGTVTFVDDIGNIHMEWETGSSLALIEGVDEFIILSKKTPTSTYGGDDVTILSPYKRHITLNKGSERNE